MPNTSLPTTAASTAEQFNEEVFREYLSRNVLAKFTGTGTESVLQLNENLMKNPGDAITFHLISAATGAGVTGNSTLEGNEEEMNVNGQRVLVDTRRNAHRLAGRIDEQRAPFEFKAQFRPNLTSWMAQLMETDTFIALGSVDGVDLVAATEAQKDAHLANNSDRVLFGDATSNNSSNDHSASLANIDSTNDIMDTDQISLARRLAQLADPKIRPIRMQGGEEIYVMFAHHLAVRDLKASDAWREAQREAMPRGMDNPIFVGAAGMYDGVVIVETDKILLLDNVGAGSIDVAQNLLCGAQAALWAQAAYNGQKMVMTEKQFDYDNQVGISIASTWGVEKAVFAVGSGASNKDHGVVTVYSSAVAD